MDLWGDLRALWLTVGYLRRQRFDIVHTHSTKAGLWGRIAARLAGVPVVVYTPNAFRFLAFPSSGLKHGFYVALERIAQRFGTAIIAASESEAELARERRIAPPNRVFRVNNGVDLDQLLSHVARPEVRAELGLPRTAPLVTAVARLYPQKALHVFIDAARRVAQAIPEVHFVIVGDGPLKAKLLTQIAEVGLAGRLTLVDYTSEVPQLLLESTVFVLTSEYEGLSYAAIEAGALARPLVLSDVPGLRDVVRHGVSGFLVKPGRSDQFAERINQLLRDASLRERLSVAAHAFIAKEFSTAQMMSGTERVYEELFHRGFSGSQDSSTPRGRAHG
jgi:glycosyltransferase involved in cell wall biosynthesis